LIKGRWWIFFIAFNCDGGILSQPDVHAGMLDNNLSLPTQVIMIKGGCYFETPVFFNAAALASLNGRPEKLAARLRHYRVYSLVMSFAPAIDG
jgi:hypothetical protein